MSNEAVKPSEISEDDVVFQCTKCAHLMAVDKRASGMVATCPQCQTRMIIPRPEEASEYSDSPEDQASLLKLALADSESTVMALHQNIKELTGRRTYLEKLRTDNMQRFDKIRSELAVIQSAFDRIVSMLDDATMDSESNK